MFSFNKSRSRLRVEISRSRSRLKTGRLRNPVILYFPNKRKFQDGKGDQMAEQASRQLPSHRSAAL